MDFFKVLGTRHSVRAFEDRPVDGEAIVQILDAMNTAPSAGDLQAFEVVVVKDPERRERLAEAAHQPYVAQAPVVLAFFIDPERSRKTYGARGARLYALQDATIAAAYAQLAAQALGLATGHPAERPGPTPRRDIEELVQRESFRSPERD